MGEIHPGLLRRSPLIVSSARYNQNLHSNMVLLEVGNYLDEEEAALHSADMLADVVAAMLAEVTAPGYKASIPKPSQQTAVATKTKNTTATSAKPATSRQQAVTPPQNHPQPAKATTEAPGAAKKAGAATVTPPKSAVPVPTKSRP